MREIWTSIRRTPYQSLAAFSVLFFTLFLSMALFVTVMFLTGLLGYVETRPQVTAYFQVKTAESDIFKIRDELVSSGKALSIKYISKQDAFGIYKNLNKDNPLLLEMVTADILPPSLEIFAKKPSYLPEIAAYLKTQPGIEEVNFQKDIVDRLLTLTSIVRRAAIIFFVFLIFMSTLVLTTTTLFKIALKKDEIELMRLLGASGFYIKKPFLLEGVIFGIVASSIAFLIQAGMYLYAAPFLSAYLRGIPDLNLNLIIYQLPVWPMNVTFVVATYGLSLVFGIGIATVANLLATEKYLK